MKYWQIVKEIEERLDAAGWPQNHWGISLRDCNCGCGHMKVYVWKDGRSEPCKFEEPRDQVAGLIGPAADEIAAEFARTRAVGH